MQVSPMKNHNFEKPSRNLSNRTKVKILKKIFLDISKKKSVPHMLSHRRNVRTSKFWRKSKKKKRNFFENLRRAYKDLIQVKKNSKLSHACVPLRVRHSVPFSIQKGAIQEFDMMSFAIESLIPQNLLLILTFITLHPINFLPDRPFPHFFHVLPFIFLLLLSILTFFHFFPLIFLLLLSLPTFFYFFPFTLLLLLFLPTFLHFSPLILILLLSHFYISLHLY